MKKTLLMVCTMIMGMCAYAQNGIVTETPSGTLCPTVYGISQKTYLVAQGGFGSFTENAGYRTSMVIDGENVWLHNVIREYPGMDSWVKGRFTASDRVEFEFPQAVAIDPKSGETLYASMITGIKNGQEIQLVPDEAAPNLVLGYDGSSYSQILPGTAAEGMSVYDGMIGLMNESGMFMSYAEQGVSYTVWDKTPEAPASDIATVSYTATYLDEWNDSHKGMVKIGIDGDTAWINGLCDELPDSWVKGHVGEDGSISLKGNQYLGIANEYFYFYFPARPNGPVNYSWIDETVLMPVNGGYEAMESMMINLGCTRPWFGHGIANLTLVPVVSGDPIPVNPEFGEPEWSSEEGMGVADVEILPEDINGQALDPANLYYRVYFDGELAAIAYDDSGEPIYDLKYGENYDFAFFEYNWHFIIFLEPLKSIGVQSVYKVVGNEYCSDIVTFDFPSDAVESITGEKAPVATAYYNMSGVRISEPSGLCIRKVTYSDGSVSASKVIVR